MSGTESIPVPVPDGPAGLLLSRDLFFTSKVTGTASALGHKIIVAGNVALVSAMLDHWRPVAVFADLAAGDLVAPANLARFREQIGPDTPFLAFGSHVDVEALAAARASGCDPVLPRSKFTIELPDLIRSYFAPARA